VLRVFLSPGTHYGIVRLLIKCYLLFELSCVSYEMLCVRTDYQHRHTFHYETLSANSKANTHIYNNSSRLSFSTHSFGSGYIDRLVNC